MWNVNCKQLAGLAVSHVGDERGVKRENLALYSTSNCRNPRPCFISPVSWTELHCAYLLDRNCYPFTSVRAWKYTSSRRLAYDNAVDSGIINLTFYDHRLCCVKIVNQFQSLQFSVIMGVYKDYLSVETRGTRHIVGRRASVRLTRLFTGDVLNLHLFLAADSFRYGRRRGSIENANARWPSRRKYSRTHGGHRYGTNGGMSRTFTVDFWMTGLSCIWQRAHVRRPEQYDLWWF